LLALPIGTKSLLATPLKTEDELERTVFETLELLQDIFLLKRCSVFER